jgi:hypothetical protein
MLRLAGLAALLLFPGPGRRYDESGHHAVVYALARLGDFNPADASLLADASQSLDENDSTTAFSISKLLASARPLLDAAVFDAKHGTSSSLAALRDLPHMVSGQGMHALTEHRETVERWHVARIEKARASGREDMAKLYLGQYLHFVADAVVHPKDPFLGHVEQAHDPDRPEGVKLRLMMTLVSRKIREFKEPEKYGKLTPLRDGDYAVSPALDTKHEAIAAAVESHWRPDAADGLRAVFQKVRPWSNPLDALDPEGLLERERAATAAIYVRRALQTFTGKAEPIHLTRIKLDADGELREEAHGIKPNELRPIEAIGLSTLASYSESFQEERAASVRHAMRRAFTKGAEAAETALGWSLPLGPGGVALKPGFRMPDVGDVRQITLGQNGEVVIDTSSGRFPLDGVRPRSLATILRTVAAGEVPFVSIGTEPSLRPGFAAVTLSPSLRGTREGALLYRADLQFKALFADYPFGDTLDLNVPTDAIARGFPGMGGESMRFWITCSGIELENQGGRLVRSTHGMKINSETLLIGEPVPDPTMEAYAARLTSEWETLTKKVWEFSAVEELALECALAFWVRDQRVRVNEVIWLLPAVFDHTPDHAPLVAVHDRQLQVTGGVTLTPEEHARAPGRMLLFRMANTLDRGEQGASSPVLHRALMGLVIGAALAGFFLASAGLFWLSLRFAVPHATFRGAVLLWTCVTTAYAGLALLAAVFIRGDWIAMFDRNFVAFLLVVLAPPTLLWSLVHAIQEKLGPWAKDLRERGRAWLPTLCSFGVPATAGLMGFGLAMLTITVVGVIPSPGLEWVLTAQLAPGDMISESFLCGIGRPGASDGGILPVPRSLVQSLREFKHHVSRLENPGEPEIHSSEPHPMMPWQDLKRVSWPGTVWIRPGVHHYTPDGRPPYQHAKDTTD